MKEKLILTVSILIPTIAAVLLLSVFFKLIEVIFYV